MPKPYKEIAAERKADILAEKPLIPNGTCHFCKWKVPPKAHYCSGVCATDFEAERKDLLGS